MIKITEAMLKEEKYKEKHVFVGGEGRLVVGLLNSRNFVVKSPANIHKSSRSKEDISFKKFVLFSP